MTDVTTKIDELCDVLSDNDYEFMIVATCRKKSLTGSLGGNIRISDPDEKSYLYLISPLVALASKKKNIRLFLRMLNKAVSMFSGRLSKGIKEDEPTDFN